MQNLQAAKKSHESKMRTHLIGLIAPVLFIFIMWPPAAWADVALETDSSDYILQSGGWNQPKPKGLVSVGVLQTQAAVDEEGFFQALDDAVARWNGEATMDVNIESCNISDVQTLQGLMQRYLNSHGECFFLKSNYRYSVGNPTMEKAVLFFDTAFSKNDVKQFDDKVNEILAGVNPSWNDEQKALYLHDYLDSHCKYDLTYKNYDAYDALITGSAVCQGYSLAYDYLLSRVGVACDIVSSEVLNHAWNLVTVDGKRYYVDCTWDDPSNWHAPSMLIHENFLRSKVGIVSTGHAEDESGKGIETIDGNVATDWTDTSGNNVYNNDTAIESTDYEPTHWWTACRTVIPSIGSLWAYTAGSGLDNAVYVHDYQTGTNEKLTNIGFWSPSSTSYWPNNFASLSSTGKDFVVAEPTTVSFLSTAGQKTTKYELSAAQKDQGQIFSLLYNDTTGLYEGGLSSEPQGELTGAFSLSLRSAATIASTDGDWGVLVTCRDAEQWAEGSAWKEGELAFVRYDAESIRESFRPVITSVSLRDGGELSASDYEIDYQPNDGYFVVNGKGTYAGKSCRVDYCVLPPLLLANLPEDHCDVLQAGASTILILKDACDTSRVISSSDYEVNLRLLDGEGGSQAVDAVEGLGSYEVVVQGKGVYSGMMPICRTFRVVDNANPDPGAGPDPNPDPGTDPDPNPNLDPNPNPNPNPNPDPGTDPDPNSGSNPDPNTNSTPNQSQNTNHSSNAGSNSTSTEASTTDSASEPAHGSTQQTAPSVQVGTEVVAGSGPSAALYVVAKADDAISPAEVVYSKAQEPVKAKSAVVPDSIIIDGKICSVTGVAAGAFKLHKQLTKATIGSNVSIIGKGLFKKCKKLKVVTVKSGKLTKSAIKNLLKGSKIKTIKLSGKSAKAMKKTYQKWAGKKVKVK